MSSRQYKTYHTGFDDQRFEIHCNNDEGLKIAEFLFKDFPSLTSEQPPIQYDLIVSGPSPTFSLLEGDKQLYSGTSSYQLAYTLMNEVIFHCINTNESHHAIHAGVVFRNDNCFLLPGQSGNGKSTLASWLVMNGFSYLSDELVFLDSDARTLPLTRPISLKVGPGHKSWLLPEVSDDIITSESGSMIPHRLLNQDFTPCQPKITHIIYPQFDRDAEPELQEISPARSSLYLLRSHVNARNLQDHGIPEMAAIVKDCRSFTLSYSSFDDLEHLFGPSSELFA